MTESPIKSLPLLGDLIEDFPDTETLPTNGQAVLLLANYVQNKGLTISEASQEVTNKLFEIWNNKSDQPQELTNKFFFSNKLIGYYNRLERFDKLLVNTEKEREFISLMNRICNLKKNKSNKQKAPVRRLPTPPPVPEKRARRSTTKHQFIETLDSDHDDEEGDQLVETVVDADFKPYYEKKETKQKIDYITDEICESIIKSNMTCIEAFKKFKQDILASGGNLDDYVLSYQTIAFRLKQYKANKQKAPVKRPPSPPPLREKRVRKSTKNDQFLETFTSDEDDEEEDQLMETVVDADFKPYYEKKETKQKIDYITDEICESIIKSNMTCIEAFKKFKQDILASGGNLDDYVLSYQTIAFRVKQYKAKLSSKESL